MSVDDIAPTPVMRPEAVLRDAEEWAIKANRHRYFLYRRRGDGPLGWIDDRMAFLSISLGRPENDPDWMIDFDNAGQCILWRYNNRAGTRIGHYEAVSEALEGILSTREMAA